MEDAADDLRFRGDNFKFLAFIDDISVGCGADPLPVLLAALDDVADLLRSIGDRHFVNQELELDFQPVVIIGKIDAVADGNDAHSGIPQVLQFHQAAGIAAGKTGEVLDHQDIVLMGNEALAHSLVAFPLLKGVAGAVPVLVKGQGTIREALLHKVLDNGFLVFDGDVIPVQFIIHRDAAIARNVKAFGHDGIAPLSGGFRVPWNRVFSILSTLFLLYTDNIVHLKRQECKSVLRIKHPNARQRLPHPEISPAQHSLTYSPFV